MSNETLAEVLERQAREYSERMEALCAKLGPVALAHLIQPLLPKVREALAAGDVHLNSIPLAVWDKLAGMQSALGPQCCGKFCHSKFCPRCGKQMRRTDSGALWPYSDLRETAQDPSLPWRNARGLSLSERVGALKHTAERRARETAT